MSFASINYKEFSKKKNLDYKSVEVSYGGDLKKRKIFNSGDFVKDWYDYRKFLILKLSDKEMYFGNSSSIDHFIMDGAPYDSAYLLCGENIEPKLVYEYTESL